MTLTSVCLQNFVLLSGSEIGSSRIPSFRPFCIPDEVYFTSYRIQYSTSTISKLPCFERHGTASRADQLHVTKLSVRFPFMIHTGRSLSCQMSSRSFGCVMRHLIDPRNNLVNFKEITSFQGVGSTEFAPLFLASVFFYHSCTRYSLERNCI